MLSLGAIVQKSDRAESAEREVLTSGSRLVLPRLWRRPARLVRRLLAGDVSISPRGWRVMIAGLLVASSVGIFSNTRQGHSVVAQASAGLGFVVGTVQVEGLNELSEVDVISRLELGASKSLFLFDVEQARLNIGKLAWVKDVVVAKAYPDKIVIRIVERKPFAIWQNGNSLALIERGGADIDQFDSRFSKLPLLVGKGANVAGADIMFLVNKYPELREQVSAFIRVGDRRWDLRLSNGINIKLPADNVDGALRELVRLNTEYQLLERDLKVVDLRLSDRLVVQLNDGAQIARDERASGAPNRQTKEKKI